MIEFFVSYRTADEPYAAALISQVLAERVGQNRVFLDTVSLRPGEPFPREIDEALDSCRTLIAVIGPRWLEPDSSGARQIDTPGDYVRREIVRALQRGITLVPVLVGGAMPPTADALPGDIAALVERQAVVLRMRGAVADTVRLVDDLEAAVATQRGVAPRAGVHNVFYGDVSSDTIGISHASYGSRGRDQ